MEATMKKRVLLLSGIASSILLVLVLISYGAIRSPATVLAQGGVETPDASVSDEGVPVDSAQTAFGSDEAPYATVQAGGQPESPAVPNAGTNTLVYFSPQDNDGTTTVSMLYNTSEVTITVNLKSFHADNTLVYNSNITVGPGGLIHLISDSLVASPPTSWGGSNSLLFNFGDSTTYVVLSIPAGVRLDGYSVFNPGTGTIDPRTDQGGVPLRFSTDPLTMLLPTVLKAP
jgi:hypothetical protein